MKYPVIAECVDARTGKRFFPGDDFTPPPTDTQLARLTQSGCIAKPGATIGAAAQAREAIGDDNLAARKVADLRNIAKAEKIDLGKTTDRDEILALIRQARATRTADGLDGLDVAHLRVLAGAAGVTFNDTTDPTTLAAAIRERRAIDTAQQANMPLGEQSLEQLQAIATSEGADVTVATADAAALITAIELKRSASA